MMFSSRRSRNRHSANPNPKLHSPHLRRKISPHDGRSAQPHPILMQSQGMMPGSMHPFSPFPLLTPPPDARHPALSALDYKSGRDMMHEKYMHDEHMKQSMSEGSSLHDDDDDDDDEEGIVVVGDEDDNDHDDYKDKSNDYDTDSGEMVNYNEPTDFSIAKLSKNAKASPSDVDDAHSGFESNEDSESMADSHSNKDDSSVSLIINKRKRKSQNPIRFAVPVTNTMDSMSDDNDSNDDMSYARRAQKEPAAQLKRSRSEDNNTPSIRVSTKLMPSPPNTPIMADDNDKPMKDASPLIKRESRGRSVEPENLTLDLSRKRDSPKSDDMIINENNNKIDKKHTSPAPTTSPKIKEEDEDDDDEQPKELNLTKKKENHKTADGALRHLENLSQSHFNELMMSRGGLLGHQFPPLNFMMNAAAAAATAPLSPARSRSRSRSRSASPAPRHKERERNYNSDEHDDDDDNELSDTEIPIDQDNPRKCTACGKVFPNHFALRAHYQMDHLKLSHKCTIDGCNAAFPSKRSRDRHSSNLNLHRKLLSTSSDKGDDRNQSPTTANRLQTEFLARLYADSQRLPFNLEALKNNFPEMNPFAASGLLNGGDPRFPPSAGQHPPNPFLFPPLGALAGFPNFPSFAPHLLPHSLNGLSAALNRRQSADSPASAASPTAATRIPSPIMQHHDQEATERRTPVDMKAMLGSDS